MLVGNGLCHGLFNAFIKNVQCLKFFLFFYFLFGKGLSRPLSYERLVMLMQWTGLDSDLTLDMRAVHWSTVLLILDPS